MNTLHLSTPIRGFLTKEDSILNFYTFVFKDENDDIDYTEVMAHSTKEAKEEVNRLIADDMVHPDTLENCIEIIVED